MSIRFHSDHNTTAGGWRAIVESMMISVKEPTVTEISMILYPNPARDIIHVEISQIIETPGQIRIYDLQGKLMLEQSTPLNTSMIKLNVSEFHSGVYLLSLSGPKSLRNRKKLLIH